MICPDGQASVMVPPCLAVPQTVPLLSVTIEESLSAESTLPTHDDIRIVAQIHPIT
jgi:hypothetical protein